MSVVTTPQSRIERSGPERTIPLGQRVDEALHLLGGGEPIAPPIVEEQLDAAGGIDGRIAGFTG
jgi:hypothetical protein